MPKLKNRYFWWFSNTVFKYKSVQQGIHAFILTWKTCQSCSTSCIFCNSKEFRVTGVPDGLILCWQEFIQKCPKLSISARVFENLKLAVKHCYQTGHFCPSVYLDNYQKNETFHAAKEGIKRKEKSGQLTMFENHPKCPIYNFSNFGIFHQFLSYFKVWWPQASGF